MSNEKYLVKINQINDKLTACIKFHTDSNYLNAIISKNVEIFGLVSDIISIDSKALKSIPLYGKSTINDLEHNNSSFVNIKKSSQASDFGNFITLFSIIIFFFIYRLLECSIKIEIQRQNSNNQNLEFPTIINDVSSTKNPEIREDPSLTKETLFNLAGELVKLNVELKELEKDVGLVLDKNNQDDSEFIYPDVQSKAEQRNHDGFIKECKNDSDNYRDVAAGPVCNAQENDIDFIESLSNKIIQNSIFPETPLNLKSDDVQMLIINDKSTNHLDKGHEKGTVSENTGMKLNDDLQNQRNMTASTNNANINSDDLSNRNSDINIVENCEYLGSLSVDMVKNNLSVSSESPCTNKEIEIINPNSTDNNSEMTMLKRREKLINKEIKILRDRIKLIESSCICRLGSSPNSKDRQPFLSICKSSKESQLIENTSIFTSPVKSNPSSTLSTPFFNYESPLSISHDEYLLNDSNISRSLSIFSAKKKLASNFEQALESNSSSPSKLSIKLDSTGEKNIDTVNIKEERSILKELPSIVIINIASAEGLKEYFSIFSSSSVSIIANFLSEDDSCFSSAESAFLGLQTNITWNENMTLYTDGPGILTLNIFTQNIFSGLNCLGQISINLDNQQDLYKNHDGVRNIYMKLPFQQPEHKIYDASGNLLNPTVLHDADSILNFTVTSPPLYKNICGWFYLIKSSLLGSLIYEKVWTVLYLNMLSFYSNPHMGNGNLLCSYDLNNILELDSGIIENDEFQIKISSQNLLLNSPCMKSYRLKFISSSNLEPILLGFIYTDPNVLYLWKKALLNRN